MKLRTVVPTAALVFFCNMLFADSATRQGITPVQAELIADLNARLLKVGQTVYARVTADWRGTDCVLTNGSILEGQVISVFPRTKNVRGSELGLAFTKAECGVKKMSAFGLMLAAMAAPPGNSDLGILNDTMPVVANVGLGGGLVTIKTMQFAAMTAPMRTELYQGAIAPQMKMGDVSGIRGLKLAVGSGPDSSSVLSSKDHDVSLERHSLLLLVPVEGFFPHAPAGAVASQPGSVQPGSADAPGDANAAASGNAAAGQPPVEDVDLCAPPQCSQALPPGAQNEIGSAASTISTHDLGYVSRPQRVMNGFDNDEALAYLGPKELLVAFNPHVLVTRHVLGRSGFAVRVIRAATVDTDTHRVTHTVDWELPDNHQFLWPLAEGRVLVHVGSELRVYGSGLKILNRIVLDGPVAYVRATPDGSYMAVGVIRERHSPELHAQLRESLQDEPEEDINILVLNRNFEIIAQSTTRSRLMPPTLLNEGQAKLLAAPHERYSISVQSWDNHTRTIARFSSSCTPDISSVAPDMIFLVRCEKQTQAREYRVLHADGKLALKSDSNLNECGQGAESSANQSVFVVKTVQSTMPMPPGALFTANDFTSEGLGVYRAADGKRLLGVRAGSPSSSRDGYALSPDGSQLAVLTRDQVAIYNVPAK